jgi:hypothetical protein
VMNIRTMRTRFALWALVGLLAACASQMQPAKQAIDSVESAVNAASADAGKYVPDQLTSVQAGLANLKTSFDNKDYKAVIAGAPKVLAEAQALVGIAAAKKEEVMKAMTAEWTAVSASLPQLMRAVQSRLNVLAKSRKPPAGVDVAAAKTAMTDAGAMWTQAQSASTAGNIDTAVDAAKKAKEKAESAASALKMTLPGA